MSGLVRSFGLMHGMAWCGAWSGMVWSGLVWSGALSGKVHGVV